jgi:hypothetical protein
MPSGFPSSSNNVAPRLGLAWNPRTSTIFRAAFGLFYDMLMEYEMFPLTTSIPGTGSAPLPVGTDIGGVKSFKTVLRRVTVTVSGSLDHRL